MSKEPHLTPDKNQLPDFIGRKNCIFMPFWTVMLNHSLLICVDIEEKTVLFLEMEDQSSAGGYPVTLLKPH